MGRRQYPPHTPILREQQPSPHLCRPKHPGVRPQLLHMLGVSLRHRARRRRVRLEVDDHELVALRHDDVDVAQEQLAALAGRRDGVP